MKPFHSWSSVVTIATLALCAGVAFAAPNVRVKRDDEPVVAVIADAESAVNPLSSQDAVAIGDDLDRDKRKVPDPKYETKNAILGFVFGKINSFIDAKTRFIDKLDHANIEKNKQHHIEPPKPVPDFQSLISSVITPKVQFITSKIGSLSGSFLGGSSGGHGGDDDHHGNGGGGAPQLGNIVSSLLKLSGPILSGSSGGQHGGSNTASKQSAQAVKDAIHPTKAPIPVTTDDTPDLDRQKVSLQVPDELFGSSFTLVTNISGRIGDLIMNSARRAGEFFWVFQPLFGKHLTIEIPTTTTTTTTQRTTTTTRAARTTTDAALVLDLLSEARCEVDMVKHTAKCSNKRLFGVTQMLTLLVILLTILSPTAKGKAVVATPGTPTGNEINVELGNSVSGASESTEVGTTEEETATTTSTTPINPTLNEVNPSSDEIPIFNRNQVTLDLPEDLFSSTANLTLRLRSFIGDLITRTSVRIAQVVRFFQPVFGYHLMIDIPKELDV
uniref:Uncharacterized protein n=1 Tax=Anopheles minimus TaxID=112268 RepID=A0A182W677_9DIPT